MQTFFIRWSARRLIILVLVVVLIRMFFFFLTDFLQTIFFTYSQILVSFQTSSLVVFFHHKIVDGNRYDETYLSTKILYSKCNSTAFPATDLHLKTLVDIAIGKYILSTFIAAICN